MQLSELIKLGVDTLKEKNIKTHQIDSEIILANLFDESREKLLISEDKVVSKDKIKYFKEMLQRRARKSEPIAYILNKKEFWNSKLFVNSDVLIPRPETELLIDKLVSLYKNKNPYILDIGTGSGCIIISLLEELKESKGTAIDISIKALEIAKKNSKKNNTFRRIKFEKKSVESYFNKKFDVIVSNPPYIPSYYLKNLMDDVKLFEPKIALDGGNDGLDVIRKVIYKSKRILKTKGMLALEIGNGQYNKVSQILKNNNFREKFLVRDYQKNIRSILSVLDENY